MIKKLWMSIPLILCLASSSCAAKPDSLDNTSLYSTEAIESTSSVPVESFYEENTQAETSGNAVEFSLHQMETAAYDEYAHEDADIVPSLEDMARYLKRTIAFHNASILGEVKLWNLEISEEPPVLLVSYSVQESGQRENAYFGVDGNNGDVYRWSASSSLEQEVFPQIVDSPKVFPTALSALECVKNQFWTPSNFTVPFELELIPGTQDSTDEDQYPYYKSQTIYLGNGQSSTYYITIDQQIESAYLIHSYESVMDSPEEGHTATTSWTLVYENGFIVDNLLNNRWIAKEAMK